jgi:hypothetical protein
MIDYEAQARRELLAEGAAAFQKRVEARVAKLQEADRQVAEGAVVIRRDARRGTTNWSPAR